MSKKKFKKRDKKKYYLLYVRNKLIAIAKSENTIHDYILDRFDESDIPHYHIEEKKLPTEAEEYEDFIKPRKLSDKSKFIESVKEHRYRKLIYEEANVELKDRKKRKKKLAKKIRKNKASDKNMAEYDKLIDEIKDLKNIEATVTQRILTESSDVDEYLKSHEILEMIARGEI